MATIQIKNVPDETHAVLRQRAARAGQSLQEYMLAHLIDQASYPTNDELMDEWDADPPLKGVELSTEQIVAMIHDERARRP